MERLQKMTVGALLFLITFAGFKADGVYAQGFTLSIDSIQITGFTEVTVYATMFVPSGTTGNATIAVSKAADSTFTGPVYQWKSLAENAVPATYQYMVVIPGITAGERIHVTLYGGNGDYSVIIPAGQVMTSFTFTPPSKAAVTASGPTTFCQGDSVMLTASTGSSYLWNTGATTQGITALISGTYTVTVGHGVSGFTSQASTVVTVTAMQMPTITAGGPTTFCQGDSVMLIASAGTSYLWNTGATTKALTVGIAGSYSVTVTNGTCTATTTNTSVTVHAALTATITPNGATTFCQGDSVVLTANSGSSYVWNTGATTQSITVKGSAVYGVKVLSGPGCPAIAVLPVVVHPLPTATITTSGPTTFCQGGSVTLTASIGGGYLWSTGAGSQSITVATPGAYTVTVTDGVTGCINTSNPVTVIVNSPPAPTITASGPTVFCEGGSVTLSSSSAFGNMWSNGATSPSITVTTSGNYQVVVGSVLTNCPGISVPVTVTVLPRPSDSVAVSGQTSFCQGGSVTLTATTGATYQWSTGATASSVTVTTPGNYTVTVTDTNGCMRVSKTVAITVHPTPTATITTSGPTTFCQGGSVTLLAGNANSYIWSNGMTTQGINVTTSGNYTVVASNGGCSVSSAVTVTVNPLPSVPGISVSGPTTFCQGSSVVLSAPAASAYFWSDGTTANSTVATTTGNYFVEVADANGCRRTSTLVTVLVNSLPSATVTSSGPTTFCHGGSVTLSAPAGNTYLWSTNATSQMITTASPGSYSVTVTDAHGCKATSAMTGITVHPLPNATVTPSGVTSFCEGGSVTLAVPSGTYSYYWSTGENTSSITVSNAGIYDVVVTNTVNGCSRTSVPINVIVYPNPTVQVYSYGNPASGVTFSADPTGGKPPYSFYWTPFNATTQTVTPIIYGNTLYTATVTDANQCSGSFTGTITVGIDEVESARVKMFPNPFKDNVVIQGLKHGESVELCDITGRTIESKDFSGDAVLFNCENFPNGMYFAKIKKDNSVIAIKKVVKTN